MWAGAGNILSRSAWDRVARGCLGPLLRGKLLAGVLGPPLPCFVASRMGRRLLVSGAVAVAVRLAYACGV